MGTLPRTGTPHKQSSRADAGCTANAAVRKPAEQTGLSPAAGSALRSTRGKVPGTLVAQRVPRSGINDCGAAKARYPWVVIDDAAGLHPLLRRLDDALTRPPDQMLEHLFRDIEKEGLVEEAWSRFRRAPQTSTPAWKPWRRRMDIRAGVARARRQQREQVDLIPLFTPLQIRISVL